MHLSFSHEPQDTPLKPPFNNSSMATSCLSLLGHTHKNYYNREREEDGEGRDTDRTRASITGPRQAGTERCRSKRLLSVASSTTSSCRRTHRSCTRFRQKLILASQLRGFSARSLNADIRNPMRSSSDHSDGCTSSGSPASISHSLPQCCGHVIVSKPENTL